MLKIQHVKKSYGAQQVLDNVNIVFPDTGFFAITGKSGSGKTTLLNIIASLDRADSGEVELDGIKYSSQSPDQLADLRKNKLSIIFQDSFLLDDISVNENIRLVKVLSPQDVKSDEEAEDIIKSLGIDGVKDKPANQLSGGERQRVAIARGITKGCKVILADEPTGNLDKANSENIYNILKELSKTYLIIMVTHDLDGATYADHIIDINTVNGATLDFTVNTEDTPKAEGKCAEDGARPANVKRGSTAQKIKFGTALCLKRKKLFIPTMLVFVLLMAVVLIFADIAFINPHNAEYNTYKSYGLQSVYYDLSVMGGEWLYGTPDEEFENYNKKYSKLDLQQCTGLSVAYLYYDEGSNTYGATTDYPWGKPHVSLDYIVIDDSIPYGEIVLSSYIADSMVTKEFAASTDNFIGKDITISNDTLSVTWKVNGIENDSTMPLDSYIKMSSATNALAADYRLYLEDGFCHVYDIDFTSTSYYNSAYITYDSSVTLMDGTYPAANDEIAVCALSIHYDVAVGSVISFCGKEYTVTGKIAVTGGTSTNRFYFTEEEFEEVAQNNVVSFTRGLSGIVVHLNNRSQFASLAKTIYNSADHATLSYIAETEYSVDVYELVHSLYNIRIIAVMIGVAVLVLSAVMSCYIYSNCFKSFKREMAVLLSQGASKKDIRDILNLPVAGMFVISFVVALVIFFIGIHYIDGYFAKMMEVTISLITYNVWAVLVTIAVFIAAYLVSYLFSRRKTNKISIVDMLYNRK